MEKFALYNNAHTYRVI